VDGPLAESKGKASPFAHFELPDRIEWDAKDARRQTVAFPLVNVVHTFSR